MGKLFTVFLTATAVLLLGASLAVAEDCSDTMKWDSISKVCRKACCTKDTTPGTTECDTDTEVCWRGAYCLPVSEANARRAAAAASTAHKAEEAAKAADEAKAKAEAEAEAAKAAQTKAEEEAKVADEAKAKAEAEAEAAKAAEAKAKAEAKAADEAKAKAEAERKLALAKAKRATSRGPILVALEIAFPLALPEPYDPQSIYISATLWGGWMFHAEGWWSLYVLGGVGGGKIPGPEDAGAYHFGATAGGILRPCKWFFFKGGGGYILKTPRYQEDGSPDHQGFLNVGIGFELAKKISLEPMFQEVLGDQHFGNYPAFVFTATGHIPLP